MKQFFAPISKINKKTREVHGILALEVKDKEGEIMDYEASKPYFEQWSKGISIASGGKSVGNLRVMHQPVIGGKFIGITFDDKNKRIPVVAKVSNDKAWQQILDGELNGFSIYGNALWKKRDKAAKAIRYAVEPLEGSLVDNPCMHGADFTLIKEDGQEIIAKFAGDKSPEQYWSCKKDCDVLHKTKDEAEACAGPIEKNYEENDDEEDLAEKIIKGLFDRIESKKDKNMKLKVKKVAGTEETENDDLEVELDEKALAKSIAKSIAPSIGILVKETVEEAFEDISNDVELLTKAVIKMSGLPKKSKVVVKKNDRSKDDTDEDEEEGPRKVSKKKKEERTNDRDELLPVMKAAMSKAMLVSELEKNDDEEQEEENEE